MKAGGFLLILLLSISIKMNAQNAVKIISDPFLDSLVNRNMKRTEANKPCQAIVFSYFPVRKETMPLPCVKNLKQISQTKRHT